MTNPQTNDSPAKAWVLGDEHHLRKKGVSCRLHQSDVIFSTVGWLADASQTLEYGKNYKGQVNFLSNRWDRAQVL
jgi:hypothetical protein